MLIIDRSDANVLELRLDRAGMRNAIDLDLVNVLLEAFADRRTATRQGGAFSEALIAGGYVAGARRDLLAGLLGGPRL